MKEETHSVCSKIKKIIIKYYKHYYRNSIAVLICFLLLAFILANSSENDAVEVLSTSTNSNNINVGYKSDLPYMTMNQIKEEFEKTNQELLWKAIEIENQRAIQNLNQNKRKENIVSITTEKISNEEKEKIQKDKEVTEVMGLNKKQYNILTRIVEAEAGCEDIKGRILVANVVLNRVNNKQFPDTIEKVVFQKTGSVYQFSPIYDGKYYKVKVSEKTIEAVNRALSGEDYSQGALFFSVRALSNPHNMEWFDKNLTRLFKHGNHEFFK